VFVFRVFSRFLHSTDSTVCTFFQSNGAGLLNFATFLFLIIHTHFETGRLFQLCRHISFIPYFLSFYTYRKGQANNQNHSRIQEAESPGRLETYSGENFKPFLEKSSRRHSTQEVSCGFSSSSSTAPPLAVRRCLATHHHHPCHLSLPTIASPPPPPLQPTT
jgi:hypothetical protein